MKRKLISSIAVMFIFIVFTTTIVSAKNKPSNNHSSEYARFGITKKSNAYFYKNKRIRILFDEKADHSFEYSFIDIDGTIDIRLLRNKAGNISKLKRFTPKHPAVKTGNRKEKEYIDIERCTLKDIPTKIKKTIKKRCTENKWYIIKSSNRTYVYSNKIPKDFAFQIIGTNLDIHDIGKKKDGPVLLSIGKDFNFTLTYHSQPIKSTIIKVK